MLGFLKKNRANLMMLAAAVVFLSVVYYMTMRKESYLNVPYSEIVSNAANPSQAQLDKTSGVTEECDMDSEHRAVDFGSERAEGVSSCAMNAPTFISSDLLPKPCVEDQMDKAAHTWGDQADSNVLANQNFLSPAQQIGQATVISHLKNANVGLRSEPTNPQCPAGPWHQSTYDPDLTRRPLEVSECEPCN